LIPADAMPNKPSQSATDVSIGRLVLRRAGHRRAVGARRRSRSWRSGVPTGRQQF
jgi:hypothetical protein